MIVDITNEIKSEKNQMIRLEKYKLFKSQMWVSIDIKTKSYQIYQEIALIIIFFINY